MRKINKVERVALFGGLIGSAVTNPRKALENAVQRQNRDGWNCHQVVPHETRNILVSLIQAALLVITLGMFTFSGAYLLLFEKVADSQGNAEPESSKQ